MPKGMQAIYTQTVGVGGAGSVTFNNIPQNYNDLIVYISTRSTSTAPQNVRLHFNGDTSANYANTELSGEGGFTQPYSGRQTGAGIRAGDYGAAVGGSNVTANNFSSQEFYILNYSSAFLKQILLRSVNENSNTGQNTKQTIASIAYRSNAPITSLTASLTGGNLEQNSTVTLYGIAR